MQAPWPQTLCCAQVGALHDIKADMAARRVTLQREIVQEIERRVYSNIKANANLLQSDDTEEEEDEEASAGHFKLAMDDLFAEFSRDSSPQRGRRKGPGG